MNWRSILKAINKIITTLLFLVLILTLFLVISNKASGGEQNLFGYQVKTVLSGSMEPGIGTGSIISIKSGGDMTRFKKDDVITFKTEEDILVTHRIADVKGQEYITKGDSNDAVDLNSVSPGNIIGYYTGFTVPYVGYVINFANTKEGAALLLILPGILLIVYAIVTIGRVGRRLEQSQGKVNEDPE